MIPNAVMFSRSDLRRAIKVKLKEEFTARYKDGFDEVLNKELELRFKKELEERQAQFFVDGFDVFCDRNAISDVLSCLCAELLYIQINAPTAFEVFALFHTRLACRLPALAAERVGADDCEGVPELKRPTRSRSDEDYSDGGEHSNVKDKQAQFFANGAELFYSKEDFAEDFEEADAGDRDPISCILDLGDDNDKAIAYAFRVICRYLSVAQRDATSAFSLVAFLHARMANLVHALARDSVRMYLGQDVLGEDAT